MIDIKRKVKDMGFDHKSLAASMGISKATVSMYLNGSPRLWQLENMAHAMNISVSELVQEY